MRNIDAERFAAGTQDDMPLDLAGRVEEHHAEAAAQHEQGFILVRVQVPVRWNVRIRFDGDQQAMRRIGIIRMKVAMQASPRCLAGGGHQVGEQALVEQADHAYTISTFSGCSQPFKASSKASSRRTRTASPSTISHSATALR